MRTCVQANAGPDAAGLKGATTSGLPDDLNRLERRPRQKNKSPADSRVQMDSFYRENLKSARKEIYAHLACRSIAQIADLENTPSSQRTLASLCSSINEPCSESTFTQTLDLICYKTIQAASQPATNDDTSALAFQSLHSILCKNGSPTLQELVSCGSPLLDRHVAVLSYLLPDVVPSGSPAIGRMELYQ